MLMDDRETNVEAKSLKTAVPPCSVCGENPIKYRCPRCFIQTCSLVCVKQHKIDAECSGIRDKTVFIDLKKFTDSSLLNDYRFLEDGGRKADNANRDFLPKCKRLPKRLHKLIYQARQRGIDLKLLPYPMTRRKINSTFYMFRTKQIMWHIQWCFPQAEETFTAKHVKECTPLNEELEKYIHPTKSDPIKRHKLQKYVSAGVEVCHLYLKVEGLPANKLRYHQLDAHKSITDNLSGKCIVEFPKIFVVLGNSDSDYPVITEEEERDLWKSARRRNIQIKKKQENGEKAEPKDIDMTSVQNEPPEELKLSPLQKDTSNEFGAL